MKGYLFIILLRLATFSGVSFAQPAMLKGTWVSPEQDLIEILNIGRDTSNYLSNKELREETFHLFILKDTLSFQQIYTSSATQYKIEYTDRYDLKIVHCSDSVLVVRPVSRLSKAYFQNRPVLTFKKKKYLIDKTIIFEKLYYHASTAWNSPTIALQIDSSRNLYMRYTDNSYGHDKGLASGTYSAVLDEDTYKELISHLQNCNLRTLRFGNIKGADSPDITFIVYFNGQRKYLKSMFPPRISNELLVFMMWRIQNYPKLMPTDEKRELEW